jgi:hypothetical protein
MSRLPWHTDEMLPLDTFSCRSASDCESKVATTSPVSTFNCSMALWCCSRSSGAAPTANTLSLEGQACPRVRWVILTAHQRFVVWAWVGVVVDAEEWLCGCRGCICPSC